MGIPTNQASLSNQLSTLVAQRDALIAKVKEYEKLLESSPESIFEYAENISAVIYQFSNDLTNIKYLNPYAEQLSGHSRQDIYQHPNLWFESIHINDRPTVIQSLLDLVKNNKNEILLEYRMIKHDGTIIYIHDRAVLVHNKNKQPYCIIGIATDMSEYIKTKREMLVYDQILSVAESEKSVEVAIEAILKISCTSFNWDEGEIWLADTANESLYCIKIWHRLKDEINEFYQESLNLRVKINTGFQGKIIETQSPITVTDFPAHNEFYRNKTAAKAGLQSTLGLPITYQGKVLGSLIYFSKEIKIADSNEIKSMQRIADILGGIIHSKFSNDQLKYLIRHDALTGLLNRTGLEYILESMIEKHKNEMIAIIMLDFTKFKKINVSLGLEVGDLLLKEISNKFTEHLSDSISHIANIGGDQYVFVASIIKSTEEIAPLVERIMAIVHTPFIIKGDTILLTGSIGISIYPYDGLDHQTLLKNVNISLNQAKAKGGDNIQYFSETLQKTVTTAIQIENDLRKAIAENDLRLHYQPKVDLTSGKIIGVEALIRWQHPETGLLLPHSFISVAEESDLIVYIGEWVLLEVCRHFPLVNLQIPVSINLSARQFELKYDIFNFIKLLLEKFSLEPHLLEIEVTESQLMINPTRSIEVLTSLRELGVTIALDDFGTGYSSFEYLKRFKPNRVKIDKSFIDGLPDDKDNASIVRAMIAMCHSLNMKVIAEGVENVDQVRFLIKEGCDEMQGFYFSKPLPIYDLKTLINDNITLTFPDPME